MTTQPESPIPVACTLSAEAQQARRERVLAELAAAIQQVTELPDGYALAFPGAEPWPTRLADFVLFERQCCAFLTLELAFDPAQGPIWLRLRGPEGVKPWVREALSGRFEF